MLSEILVFLTVSIFTQDRFQLCGVVPIKKKGVSRRHCRITCINCRFKEECNVNDGDDSSVDGIAPSPLGSSNNVLEVEKEGGKQEEKENGKQEECGDSARINMELSSVTPPLKRHTARQVSPLAMSSKESRRKKVVRAFVEDLR